MSSSVRLLGLQRKLLQTARAFLGYGNPFKAIHRNFFDVHFLRNSSVTFGFGSKMATASGTSTTTTTTTKTNRLAFEKSPYLLQHATNPVDWYPWGDEAFEKAKTENKPIFLSVGYSTCHWCHVMERESFEDRAVADILNARFVAVKVDREERPDVDKAYMTYVQRTTGGGGWPMSVFLTPDLEPVFGGTYFPPEDRYGRVGFKSLLKMVARQWEENHQVLGSKAKNAVEAIRRITSQSFATTGPLDIPSTETVRKCTQTFLKSYDAINGGFLDAPKFPQPSNYTYLFHVYFKDPVSSEGQEVLEACLHSLKRMAYGGIHDHVNTGFARYSVDARWHVPHFEKMLYDQGQLAVAYLEAYSISKDEFFKEIVEDILKYASRDLSHELGGFYGAEDADSYPEANSKRKREGAFCVWEHTELGNLLPSGTDFELFCYHFNVKKTGNVPPQVDPHNELTNKNVLACFQSYEDTATAFKMTVEEVKNVLKNCCEILYEERLKRPKPHVDTKMVTAWNGLMMSGFARAGFTLKNQQYTDRAVKAANFIKRFLYDEKTKVLKRCCYKDPDGNVVQISTPISGFVQDYAFLIRGLIDVYEATLDFQWLKWAEDLQDTQDKLFWDSKDFGYFTSPEGDPSIVIRDKEDQDGAEPSGNSVSVHNLVRLASYLNREDLKDKAGKTLTAFAERLRQIAFALPEMTSGLMHYVDSLPQIIIVGSRDDPETEALLDAVRAAFIPGKVLVLVDGNSPFRDRIDSLDNMKKVRGRATAYVCRNFTCTLPVCDAEALENALRVESQKKSA